MLHVRLASQTCLDQVAACALDSVQQPARKKEPCNDRYSYARILGAPSSNICPVELAELHVQDRVQALVVADGVRSKSMSQVEWLLDSFSKPQSVQACSESVCEIVLLGQGAGTRV